MTDRKHEPRYWESLARAGFTWEEAYQIVVVVGLLAVLESTGAGRLWIAAFMVLAGVVIGALMGTREHLAALIQFIEEEGEEDV